MLFTIHKETGIQRFHFLSAYTLEWLPAAILFFICRWWTLWTISITLKYRDTFACFYVWIACELDVTEWRSYWTSIYVFHLPCLTTKSYSSCNKNTGSRKGSHVVTSRHMRRGGPSAEWQRRGRNEKRRVVHGAECEQFDSSRSYFRVLSVCFPMEEVDVEPVITVSNWQYRCSQVVSFIFGEPRC